jgi:hypothetical protein
VRLPGLHLLAGASIIAAAVGVAVLHRRRSKVLMPVYEPLSNTANAMYGSTEAVQAPRL